MKDQRIKKNRSIKAPRSPLTNPTYRRFFAAQIVALAGTGITTIALALLAYDLAGSEAGVVLGTALALKMAAYVFIAPIFGSFVHRMDRRKTLVALDLGRASLVFLLPLVSEVWHIYALILLINLFSAGFTPTYQATLPQILPDEADYTRALSLSRLAYDLENLLSPLLAAALLVFLSYSSLFAINSIAFLISAALVLSISLPKAQAPTRTGGIWQKLSFGTWAYLKTPRLLALLALSLAVAAAGAMVIVNTVVYVQGSLGGGDTETAVALAGAGAGSMMTALVLPKLLDDLSDRLLMLSGGFILAVALFLGASLPGYVGLLSLWVAVGVGLSLIQTPAGRLVARSASDPDRPAVFAAQFSLSHGCWLLGYLSAGWLTLTFGFATTFYILAATCALSTLVAMIVWRSPDETAMWHSHDALSHSHEHIHDAHHGHDHEGWEGPEPHTHLHTHPPVKHRHAFHIDSHHPVWPR
ncbi:MAG: MFS transporter [Pseudomonadota bacterium]